MIGIPRPLLLPGRVRLLISIALIVMHDRWYFATNDYIVDVNN